MGGPRGEEGARDDGLGESWEMERRWGEAAGPPAPAEAALVADMSRVNTLLGSGGSFTFSRGRAIRRVAVIVVVDAEVAPILRSTGLADDDELTRAFLGLATVRSGQYGGYRLSVIKVAESKIFRRHYSGYSQAAAIAALVAKVVHPDLVISFGTAGGVPGRAAVGDVVAATGCMFLDRLRTRSKDAFDWGVWGGGCVRNDRMAAALGLVRGPVSSQIGYAVTPLQERIIQSTGAACLDMEAAPIAQILNQTGVNFLALKVVSNGVYPGEPSRMEAEYHDNREEVSRRATETLRRVLDYLKDKAVGDLAEPEGPYDVVRDAVASLLRSRDAWYDEFIARLGAVSGMTDDERARVAEALTPVEFREGEKILEFGDEGRYFYIIIEGVVDVVGRDGGRADDPAKHVCEFSAGDCVGELECMRGHRCVADVITKTPRVRAARMGRSHFARVMGPAGAWLLSRARVDDKFRYYRAAQPLGAGAPRL